MLPPLPLLLAALCLASACNDMPMADSDATTASADGVVSKGPESSSDGSEGEEGGPKLDVPDDPDPSGEPCEEAGARQCANAKLYECLEGAGSSPSWSAIEDCEGPCHACEGYGHCVTAFLINQVCLPTDPTNSSCTFSMLTHPDSVSEMLVYLGNEQLEDGMDCGNGEGWTYDVAEDSISLCPEVCAVWFSGVALLVDEGPFGPE